MCLTIYTNVHMLLNEKEMNSFNSAIIRRNRALAITAQTFSYQNATYIGEFADNNLLDEIEGVYAG